MKSDEETTMPKKTIENGLFVTFEGPEGSGKTTQIKMLAERLTEQEYEVVVTREPGGTILGEHIRKLLIEFDEEDIADEAELLLFGASRAQHMRRKILPCLKRGGIVLCDRFVDSTTAYQGYARKLDFGFIQNLHAFSLCGRWPDLTFVLDIDVDTSYQRMHKRYANSTPVNDRIEAESRAFHTAVREGFLDIAKKNPGRVKVIDANRLPEIIAADLWWEVYHAIVFAAVWSRRNGTAAQARRICFLETIPSFWKNSPWHGRKRRPARGIRRRASPVGIAIHATFSSGTAIRNASF